MLIHTNYLASVVPILVILTSRPIFTYHSSLLLSGSPVIFRYLQDPIFHFLLLHWGYLWVLTFSRYVQTEICQDSAQLQSWLHLAQSKHKMKTEICSEAGKIVHQGRYKESNYWNRAALPDCRHLLKFLKGNLSLGVHPNPWRLSYAHISITNFSRF